jgi:hypothetical protein
MDTTVKLRCPHCDGKVAIDEEYYKEIVGQSVSCPHCNEGMKVPSTVKKMPKDQEPPLTHSKSHTYKVHKESSDWKPHEHREKEAPVHCPKCKEEVGRRDRVCITCGTKLTPLG